MKRKVFKENSLYLVTGEECSAGRTTLEVVGAAIRGGVDVVQMREKHLSPKELRELGTRLSELCAKNDVMFIVNDDPCIAKEVGADGVHLGQEDIKNWSLSSAREFVGQDGIIGISTHSVEEAAAASSGDSDYIAFGPVFPTKTKDYFIGTRGIPEVLRISSKPVVFIGGICSDNIDELFSLGARNIAMIRHITAAPDIESRVRGIKQRMILSGGTKARANVSINGKTEILEGRISIEKFIGIKGLIPEHVVIEHNSAIVPREKWNEVFLSGGDNVEIVSFVGGG
ncbi:MAG: thiamine phosphate synthase [Candidatus Omnitrophota bacterium]